MAGEGGASEGEVMHLSTPPTVGSTVENTGEAYASSVGTEKREQIRAEAVGRSRNVPGVLGGPNRAVRNQCSPAKKRFAKWLRKHPTAAEQALWQCLKARQLGPGFRRQSVLFGWIADFYCPRCKLVVEVDGLSHIGRERDDAKRDAILLRHGYRTLRIPAVDVYRNLPAVVRRIAKAIDG